MPAVDPQVLEDLEVLDGLTEVKPDRIPTVDQEVPVASYADYDKSETRVVTCRIGNDVYSGERFESRDEARIATEAKHGRILEANYTPGRAFFRVRK